MGNWLGYTGRRDEETSDGVTMVFKIYRDKKKEWRWRLRSKNGRTVADSSEGYKRKSQVAKIIGKIIIGPHRIVE